MVKPAEVKLAFEITVAIAEAIRHAGSIPSGHLYAALMSRLTLHAFEQIINTLKNTGLIEERAHVLRWTGPHIPNEAPVCAECREPITNNNGVQHAKDGAAFHGRCWNNTTPTTRSKS